MTKNFTYPEIARMIDHALLHPTLSETELINGCTMAAVYQTATVCVKPCDVKQAALLLSNSQTGVCTVIGFPHGVNLTEIKVRETELACDDGAIEVDMVINTGRAISGDWGYIEADIRAICETAHSKKAKLKVIFENDFLLNGGAGLNCEELKKKLCQICENAGADWVKTSTGFGYAHQADGSFASLGATVQDVTLMVNACQNGTQVKAAGAVRDLSTLLRMKKIGATRIGTSSTQAILDECREILDLPAVSMNEDSNHEGY
ncbi:MAG: deoxyribose-phosphate aldolase [Opitutae bacterium]